MVDSVSTSSGPTVTGAIKTASQKTGVGFDFLYRMAQRESSLDPTAKASTSSAAGLFQFIEQTWFGAIKAHGEKHGLTDFAADIERGSNGKFTVADDTRRQEILDLRFDASKASALAAELANDNKTGLEKRLGRQVGGAELYAAHFLGVGGASKLLSAPEGANAAAILPAAANANKPVFYNGNVPRTVAEVMAGFEKSMGVAMKKAEETIQEIKSSLGPSIGSTLGAGLNNGPVRAALQASPLRPVVPLLTTTSASPASLETAATRLSPQDVLRSATDQMRDELSPLALVVLQALDPTALRNSQE